ncbi:MAG: DUF3795 domain-containing protein [Desulfobacteraceae bacterium]|nr:MAG: DUF3795 domain-containing protein [Desulfobacteraceae bacterium]
MPQDHTPKALSGPSIEQIKDAIAPCGLSCNTCFAHVDSEIRALSLQLLDRLGNFDAYAPRFEVMLNQSVFRQYPAFKEMLQYFASENCKGCRHEQCKLFKDCGVRVCHQEKGIDFCYECDEFPCSRTNFDAHLHQRWIKWNEIIQKKGIEAFYKGSLTRPRYI